MPSIFDKFVQELRHFAGNVELPADAGQSLRYSLELQQKRLEKRNIDLEYEFIPRGHFAEASGLTRGWSDDHYSSRMDYRSSRMTRAFYRGGKKIYEKQKDILFYETITDVLNQDAVENDLYTCPNCGAITQVGALQNGGCPYCGTFFRMSDLFPKVTNYYFIEDSGGTEKEIKKDILKVVLPCMLAAIILTLIGNLSDENAQGLFGLLIVSSVLTGSILGGILGYFVWAVRKLVAVIKNAGKAMPMVVNATGSRKRFASMMQRYSREFSYEYFSDKVVSILKMIIFSEDTQQLPYYAGAPLGTMFEDIVDASYCGAVALKKFRVVQEFCYVTVDVYMENFYDTGRKIRRKNDIFRIRLRKNISRPIQLHFSIKEIECRSCGGSFDATKHRICPNCGTAYPFEDEEWIVESVQRR